VVRIALTRGEMTFKGKPFTYFPFLSFFFYLSLNLGKKNFWGRGGVTLARKFSTEKEVEEGLCKMERGAVRLPRK
jgi:hypothetical protein